MADGERPAPFPAPGSADDSDNGRIPISAAAERLDTSPRMLRYRESLGLLPVTKEQPTGRGHRHRRFSEADLRVVAAGLELERLYDITPAALSFALRMLAEPAVLARVRAYGERLGRLAPPPARALDFEKQKALRLLQQRGRGR
ncbi:MAG: MerR family transcriptional regulator [Nocardiopsaceae bacterium]|nr:MerR family transcriptional regulator [Nocardiopsaceae bacterium]